MSKEATEEINTLTGHQDQALVELTSLFSQANCIIIELS